MDLMVVLEKYGYPILTALVMGRVCWLLLQKISDEFNRQRLEWAEDKKNLISELKAERAHSSTELFRVVIGYEKIAEDALERLKP